MKIIFTITFAATAAIAFAQEKSSEISARADSVGDLPNMRQGVTVLPGAPSPYGLPEQKKVASAKKQYSQEDQIREILLSLPVTGVIGNGKKVLLHDITLEEGEIVESVILKQTEILLVKEITPEKVIIEWIEQRQRKTPRTLEIPIDLSPRVKALIAGQSNVNKQVMGIVRLPESEEDQ